MSSYYLLMRVMDYPINSFVWGKIASVNDRSSLSKCGCNFLFYQSSTNSFISVAVIITSVGSTISTKESWAGYLKVLTWLLIVAPTWELSIIINYKQIWTVAYTYQGHLIIINMNGVEKILGKAFFHVAHSEKKWWLVLYQCLHIIHGLINDHSIIHFCFISDKENNRNTIRSANIK